MVINVQKKREARIYKDSIDVFILEDDKKEQVCES